MNTELRAVADNIIDAAIKAVLPDEAVKRTLNDTKFDGKVILVAVGKAAWQMAKAAEDYLGDKIDNGVVVTKYDHVRGSINRCVCIEAGHPVPDENSFRGTQEAIEAVSNLTFLGVLTRNTTNPARYGTNVSVVAAVFYQTAIVSHHSS